MLLDKAAVNRLKGGIANHFKFNGGKVREVSS